MVVMRKKVSGHNLAGDGEDLMLNLKVNLQILLDDPNLPSFHRRFLMRSLRIVEQMMGEGDYSAV